MNEKEQAERFLKDWEAGERAALGGDEAALALARRLARSDFSAESRVRESLRARLVAEARRRQAPAGAGVLSRLWSGLGRIPVPLRAAAAAAGILLALGLNLRRPPSPPPQPPARAPRVFADQPPAAPDQRPAPSVRGPRPALPRGELGLPVLAGRFSDDGSPAGTPIRSLGPGRVFKPVRPVGGDSPFDVQSAARLIVTASGREFPIEDGSAVEWRLEGRSYRLERRKVTLSDIFETPTL